MPKNLRAEAAASPLAAVTERLVETSTDLKHVIERFQLSAFQEYVDTFAHPGKQFWFNFLMGVGRGFGFFIGGTVVVGVVVWITSKVLTQIPIVGEFFLTLSQLFTALKVDLLQAPKPPL